MHITGCDMGCMDAEFTATCGSSNTESGFTLDVLNTGCMSMLAGQILCAAEEQSQWFQCDSRLFWQGTS